MFICLASGSYKIEKYNFIQEHNKKNLLLFKSRTIIYITFTMDTFHLIANDFRLNFFQQAKFIPSFFIVHNSSPASSYHFQEHTILFILYVYIFVELLGFLPIGQFSFNIYRNLPNFRMYRREEEKKKQVRSVCTFFVCAIYVLLVKLTSRTVRVMMAHKIEFRQNRNRMQMPRIQ